MSPRRNARRKKINEPQLKQLRLRPLFSRREIERIKIKMNSAKKDDIILLGHGSGGRLMHDLLEREIVPSFGSNPSALADAAVLNICGKAKIAFTTDSFVVKPRFFKGGDVGSLAVYGTANDLAVMGATPRFVSCALIIEEGFSKEELKRVVESMAAASAKAGVKIVTGDTKVVERGAADGLFINTSGVGTFDYGELPGVCGVCEGDAAIVSGCVGEHGAAVMAAREGIEAGDALQSDAAPLFGMIEPLLKEKLGVKVMRDPTRGGLATTLNEFVSGNAGFGIEIEEASVPTNEAAAAYCDALGLDPLYVANEGKIVMIVSSGDAERALSVLRRSEQGSKAAIIGRVTAENKGKVVLRTSFGGRRILGMLAGEQLPRIC